MTKDYKAAFTAAPHLRSAPQTAAAVRLLRDTRHAAHQQHGGARWQGSPHGRMECAFCAVHGGNATQCRPTGPSCSGHGPQLFTDTDGHVKGGPDADVALFPVGCKVTCTQPPFSGEVTQFDVLSGEHTVTLLDGSEKRAFLAYHTSACSVVYPAGAWRAHWRVSAAADAQVRAGVATPGTARRRQSSVLRPIPPRGRTCGTAAWRPLTVSVGCASAITCSGVAQDGSAGARAGGAPEAVAIAAKCNPKATIPLQYWSRFPPRCGEPRAQRSRPSQRRSQHAGGLGRHARAAKREKGGAAPSAAV